MPEKYLSETQGKPSIKLYCFTLDSRPLKSILLSDIQQYNYQTSIVNLQVFVSLGIETCRFL